MDKYNFENKDSTIKRTEEDSSHGSDNIEKIVNYKEFSIDNDNNEHSTINDLLRSNQESEKEKGLILLDIFVKKILARFARITEVEAQDKLGRKLLNSPEFLTGDTILHQEQIKYIKDMMEIVEDSEFKEKLKQKLTLIEKSFLVLQIIKEEIVLSRDETIGIGKNRGAWFVKLFATGAYSGGFSLIASALAGLGETSIPLAGGGNGGRCYC